MNLDDLSPEIKAKAMECKTPEDILKLAKESGYKLSDEELIAVNGGDDSNAVGWCSDEKCYSFCPDV